VDSEIRYAKAQDGTHVAYNILGAGPLDLVLMSGLTLPIDAMDDEPSPARFQRRLAGFSRVVRFDLRGIGQSDPISPSQPPTIEQWMHDTLAVMNAVGMERAAVVAHMGSALVALLLAASHPERVSSVVVINGYAWTAFDPDHDVRALEGRESFIDATVAVDAVEQGFDLLAVVAPSVASDEKFRRWWVRAGHRGASPASARAIVRVFVEGDVREILPFIRVPVLVLHRRDSRLIPAASGRHLATHIPGATYVELPGADLLYWVGDADVLLDEIEEFLTGVRHGPEPDRVLATVLFSDIVNSTAQASAVGDRAWRDRLDAHDAVVRRQLDRFRGREIKTTGDGFIATFDGPARAIECGCAIRDGARGVDIEVRVGLHTGEIELRGDDIGGVTVNIGARVAALAGAGEVLVSRTVTDLVAGSGIVFDDRGEHELKGVPGTWRLYAVVD
jgi:class 3 adenylate cyclase